MAQNERFMDDLKRFSLDDLIHRVLHEGLIDGCEKREDRVVIVQGSTRFVLTPIRAHAFLRGVIKGMSIRQNPELLDGEQGSRLQADEEGRELRTNLPQDIMESYRQHLLEKWWRRYERAGCPFGRTNSGLMLWVRHNTTTTTN